jgi:hypothetical protein
MTDETLQLKGPDLSLYDGKIEQWVTAWAVSLLGAPVSGFFFGGALLTDIDKHTKSPETYLALGTALALLAVNLVSRSEESAWRKAKDQMKKTFKSPTV